MIADINSRTPLHTVTYWASHLTFHHRRPASDICRLLIGKGAVDTLIDDVTVIARRNTPTALLRYLQQQMYPPYESLPVSKRFELAKYFHSGGWFNMPDLIIIALGGSLNQVVTSYRDPRGHTLLHQLGRRWASSVGGRNERFHTDDVDDARDSTVWRRAFDSANHTHPWRMLLCDTILGGSPLSPVDKHGRTPLCILIRETIFKYSGRLFRNFWKLHKLLNIWLIELHKAGVDLQKYGEQEVAQNLRENVNRPIRK